MYCIQLPSSYSRHGHPVKAPRDATHGPGKVRHPAQHRQQLFQIVLEAVEAGHEQRLAVVLVLREQADVPQHPLPFQIQGFQCKLAKGLFLALRPEPQPDVARALHRLQRPRLHGRQHQRLQLHGVLPVQVGVGVQLGGGEQQNEEDLHEDHIGDLQPVILVELCREELTSRSTTSARCGGGS